MDQDTPGQTDPLSSCPAPCLPVECLPNEIPSGYFIGAKTIPLGPFALVQGQERGFTNEFWRITNKLFCT